MGWTGSEFCVKIGAELAQAEIRLVVGWKARSSAPEIHVVHTLSARRGACMGQRLIKVMWLFAYLQTDQEPGSLKTVCHPGSIRNAQLRIVRWLPEDVEED